MKNGQMILRVDDKFGHHIAGKHADGTYSVEGYHSRPDNYRAPPQYYLPVTEEDVAGLFAIAGKQWRK